MKKKMLRIINILFVIVQATFLGLILFLDADVNIFCFLTVCFGFLHAIPFVKKEKYGIAYILGLLFTVISDIFLVLRFTKTGAYSDQAIAMTTFSIAQLCYGAFLLLEKKEKKTKIIHLSIRVVLSVSVVVATLIVLKENANYLAIISLFYFANLITNTILAFTEFKKHPLFAIGLVAFVLCDIFIGLNMAVGTFITVPETSFIYQLAHTKFNYAWLFYVISQTLISLNLAVKIKCKKEKN